MACAPALLQNSNAAEQMIHPLVEPGVLKLVADYSKRAKSEEMMKNMKKNMKMKNMKKMKNIFLEDKLLIKSRTTAHVHKTRLEF